MESPFDVLGIEPDADEAAVERAYRRRVKEAHPDHGGSAREFQLVKAAHEAIVSDRAAHGVDGRNRAGPGSRRPDPARQRGAPGEAPGEEPRREARVEYLNYEVLVDEGWTLDDGDLFAKAAAAGFAPGDRGRLLVEPHESLLQAAENRGFAWPYACRGGACANCAVAVVEGELSMPVNHILPPEMLERGFRLSCNGMPTTDELKVVYNVKHLPGLDELRLPPYPFDLAHGGD